MKHHLFGQFRIVTGMLVLAAPLSCSVFANWQEEQVADALRAAPPNVAQNAKIYAWQPYGQMVLVRDGNGPYTCVASGSSALRFGKPPLPHPDPFCADQNAWAFIQAFWTEPDPDPMEPVQLLPNVPGLVWMLKETNVVDSKVAFSSDEHVLRQMGHTGSAQTTSQATMDTSTVTPQLMILPLPIDLAAAQLPGANDPTHPLSLWMTARGMPIGHMLVQFPQAVHQALTVIRPDPVR